MKIGILGSSFNPPHEGHLKISKEAIDIFALDQIWWLITEKNPFKKKNIYINFLERKQKIKSIIDKEMIELKYFEEETKSNYLIHTLLYIKNNFKNNDYIFLMGSDAFMEIDKWKNYNDILELGIFEDSTDCIKIVEWPELIKIKPKDRIDIFFQYTKSMTSRKANIVGFGKWKNYKFNEI